MTGLLLKVAKQQLKEQLNVNLMRSMTQSILALLKQKNNDMAAERQPFIKQFF